MGKTFSQLYLKQSHIQLINSTYKTSTIMNKLLLGLLAFALVSQSCINAAPTDKPTGPTAVTLEPTADPATEKVETTAQKAYDCSKGDGMYPSPYNCADFYVCFSSEVLTFTCPDKLLYNSKLKSCNWPNLVDCDIN